MDRPIVYPGQILPETTLLQMAKDAMIGSAKLAAAMLGTSTIANGFAVTPTGPASLQIVVAPGEIYSLAAIDSLAFSTLPADTTHSILKQGILLDGVTLSCPAPTTTGQSINYLVQVTYQDQDSTPVLLPYYNSANPALPYSGMGNNGLAQNTARKGAAVVQVKAGASAATGSQVTPAPDSGYVGLYVVSVAFGQTVINSGNISQYIGAPLLPSGILQSIQSGNTTYATDTGFANAYAATYSPVVTVSDTLVLRFKAANGNTGAATFSPNGIAAAPIVGGNHSALQGGEIVQGGEVWVQWNSSIGSGCWVLIESSGGCLQVKSATQSNHAVAFGQRPTETAAGVPIVATQAVVNAGVDDTAMVTAKKLAAWFAAQVVQATESVGGFAKIATQAMTIAGIDDTTIVTPLKLAQKLSNYIVQATTTALGVAKIATQAMVNAGTDAITFVTPATLRFGAAYNIANNGYIVLPAWLGGFAIQWGSVASAGTVTFPTAFTTAYIVIAGSNVAGNFASSTSLTTTSVLLQNSGNQAMSWLAFGRV